MKLTKKALLTSIVALVVCFSLLIGSTFAWFTDNVTSGVNTITAGNLDIELEYSKNGTDWATVEGTTQLFSDVTLWEPGATSVVYLKLSNLGTLALKYRFSMAISNETPGTNVEGNEFKLSNYIQFSFIEGITVYANRDAALAAAGVGTVLSAQNDAGRAHDEVGTMNAGAADRYFALVVFMPETVGNAANYRGNDVPTIKLGLNLVATQLANESDSFDNQYDGGANVGGDYMNTASAVVTAPAAGETLNIVLNNNAPASQENSTALTMASVSDALAGKEVKFTSTAMNAEAAQANFSVATGDATEVAALKLDLAVDGVATSDLGGTATVTTYIQTGLTNVRVVYVGSEGDQPTNVQYDPATGKLSFNTTHFSDYVVTAKGSIVANGVTYGTLAEAIAANEGGTINITGPVVMFAAEGSSVEVDMKGVTIDGGNNATLIFRNVDGNGAGGTGSFANVTLKNLSVVDETYYNYENGENAWEFTYLEFSGTNTFKSVIFTDGVMFEGEMSTCTGCTFIGHNNDSSNLGDTTMYGAWVTNGSAAFEGCTFKGTRGLKVSEKYNGNDVLAVTVDGCTFDNLSEKPGVAIDFKNNNTGLVGTADIIIKNSQFINCKPGDQNLYIYETDNLVPTLENNVVADVAIGSVKELLAFADDVNRGNSYAGKTVILTADIDLQGVAWTPIGNTTIYAGEHTDGDIVFAGSFNGCGHTISNLSVTGEGGNIGFFGKVKFSRESKLENVAFDNATVIGNKAHCVGVLAGSVSADGLKWVSNDGNGGGFDTDNVINITVKNSTVQGSKYVGGVVGYAQTDIDNVEVINTKVYAVYDAAYQSGASYTDENDSGENAGVVVGDLYSVFSITRAKVTDCTVGGFDKVGGVAGSSKSAHRIANSAIKDLKIEMVTVGGSSKSHYGLITGRVDSANGYASRYTGNTASGTATCDSATITVTEYAIP